MHIIWISQQKSKWKISAQIYPNDNKQILLCYFVHHLKSFPRYFCKYLFQIFSQVFFQIFSDIFTTEYCVALVTGKATWPELLNWIVWQLDRGDSKSLTTIFQIFSYIFLAVTWQLNRWPCHSLSDWLSHFLIFWH